MRSTSWWFFSAAAWFWNDWRDTISREIVETALDLLVFVSGFFVFRSYFQGEHARLEGERRTEIDQKAAEHRREDEALSEEDDEVREPVGGSMGGFHWPSDKKRILGAYQSYPTKHRYFPILTIEDIRDEEAERDEERARRRAFRVRTFYVLYLGVIPFGLGLLLSTTWRFDLIAVVRRIVFGEEA